ncbi:uncharacterized protein NEMAJ01_2296 [Nematocida major]|uniref:uncharacterized protein n=1 Tax=Nematocida major TaxID=1912982 RepID=UPI002007C2DA|nr:uncharacterized protein NEMAJ01_2296 [Nematocida major]KAH9387400.1 hypothetical protein NEMAJ01_2296 [Nematocida major]
MIEEMLAGVTAYTDEMIMDLLNEEESMETAVDDLCKIFSGISQRKLVRSEESVALLRSYFVMLIREPALFGFDCRNAVEIMHSSSRRSGICWTLLLDESEAAEEILAVLLHAKSEEFGREREKKSLQVLALHERISQSKAALGVLRRREPWGLQEPSGRSFSPWVYDQCKNSKVFSPSQESYLYRASPEYPRGVSVNNLCVVYQDFVEAKDRAKTRREMHRLISISAARLFTMFRDLVLQDKSVKRNFIESVFLLYSTNRVREKTKYRIEEALEDSRAFTVSNVLSRFLAPVLNSPEKMKGIPLDFLQRCSFLREFTAESLSGEIAHEGGDAEDGESFFTLLFYAKMLVNRITYVPLVLSVGNHIAEIQQMRRAEASSQGEQRERLRKMRGLLESEFEYAQTLLLAEEAAALEKAVLVYTVSFLHSAIKNQNFQKLPLFILENVLLSLEKLQQVGGEGQYALSAESIRKVCALSAEVLKHETLNVNYKQAALKLMCTYSESVEYVVGVVSAVVKHGIDVQNKLQNALEKLDERARVAYALSCLLKGFMGRQEMLEILRGGEGGESTPPGTVFVIHMLSALTDAQERGFEELRKISREEGMEGMEGVEEDSAREESIAQMMEHMNSFFSLVEVLEGVIVSLVEICPKVFLGPSIVHRFASMLNASIISLAGKKSKELKLRGKGSRFSAVGLLKARLMMYTLLRDVAFAAAVADDGMFKPDLFRRTIEICERKGGMTQREKSYSLLFLKTVENLQEKRRECLPVEYPDEFVDPLTFGLMKDPVILKTSNTRVDRSTASMILMTDPKDPFTRDDLTEAQVVEDAELRRRIEEFLSKAKEAA